MAKQTWKITIVAVIAIVGIVLTVGTILWGQGGEHATEAAQVLANKEDIAEIKPDIKEIKESDAKQDIAIEVLKVQQTAIYKGVEAIQKKMDILP